MLFFLFPGKDEFVLKNVQKIFTNVTMSVMCFFFSCGCVFEDPHRPIN
jgi:hypothetical protein